MSRGQTPADPAQPLLARTDLKLFAAEQQLAERVLRDSSKDRLPFLEAVFQPSSTYPGQLFFPQNTWRFLLQLNVPLYDSGQRQGLKMERQASLDVSRANLTRALTAARSEVRSAARGDFERGARARERAGRRGSGAAGREHRQHQLPRRRRDQHRGDRRRAPRRATPTPPSPSPRTRCAAGGSIS
jgi:hypothetical protein